MPLFKGRMYTFGTLPTKFWRSANDLRGECHECIDLNLIVYACSFVVLRIVVMHNNSKSTEKVVAPRLSIWVDIPTVTKSLPPQRVTQ
jgi:hypothetical protein